MKIFKFIFRTIFCIILLILLSLNTKALSTESSIIGNKNVSPGESVSILFGTNQPAKYLPENFNVRIEFDANVFKNSPTVEYNDEIKQNYRHKKENINNNTVNLSFNLSRDHRYVKFNSKKDLFKINFTVKDNCKTNQTKVTIIKSENGAESSEVLTLNINQSLNLSNCSADCKLNKLIPSQGHLSPEFNPDVHEYVLKVSQNTKYIDFDTSAGGEVHINKRKLNAAGKSPTDIIITVYGNGRKNKNVYHVKVITNKDESESDKSSKSTKGKDGKNKKSKSGKKRKSGSKNNSCENDDDDEDVGEDENDENDEENNECTPENLQQNNPEENNIMNYIYIAGAATAGATLIYLIVKKRIKNVKK